MAVIAIDKFRGYSSKNNHIEDDLRIARAIENLIIYKDDLCNLPLPRYYRRWVLGGYTVNDFSDRRKLIGVYTHSFKLWECVIIVDPIRGIKRTSLSLGRQAAYLDIGLNAQANVAFGIRLSYKHSIDGEQFACVRGNTVQIGRWLLLVGLLDDANTAPDNFPRMIRIKPYLDTASAEGFFESTAAGLVGKRAPTSITRTAVSSGGSLNGFLQFAFSLEERASSSTTDAGERSFDTDDIQESNIVLEAAGTEYNGSSASQAVFSVFIKN